jgi:hypothetical protein
VFEDFACPVYYASENAKINKILKEFKKRTIISL